MLQTVWFHRDDPRLDPEAIIDPQDAPTLTVRLYIQTRRELGSPLPDIDEKTLSTLDASAVARAQGNVLRPQP
jgi:predicted oxidoreductase